MRRSLQVRLSVWLTLTIMLITVPAAYLSYRYAFGEAIELQDDELRQTAAFVLRQRLPAPPIEVAGPPDADPESRLIVLSASPGEAWRPEAAAPGLRSDLAPGLQTVMINGAPWRLFAGADESGVRVAVGQQTAARNEIANKSALRTAGPLVSLILILPLVLGYAIRQSFRPLKRVVAELELRSEPDWRDIPDGAVPSEIRPFVMAIKRLIQRVSQSVLAQRRFLADAAHELRSPLTALSLQAERLETADSPAEARERLATLRRGIARNRGLLDQLLALARAQDAADEPVPVGLNAVFRQVLEDLMPFAEAKHMDVGVISGCDVVVRASAIDLMMLVRNLVDNAIRYTPEGGRVDLAVEITSGGAALRVEDSGPGVAPKDRERVFDPFYRALGGDETGSGFGLSIVKTIADRIGAQVSLDDAARGGLRVEVTMPKSLILCASCEPNHAMTGSGGGSSA